MMKGLKREENKEQGIMNDEGEGIRNWELGD